MNKFETLMKKLDNSIDCAVITSDINRRYMTGMKSSAGTVLVFREKAYLLIDFRYIEKASKTVTDCEVILLTRFSEQVKELCKKHNAKTIAVESQQMTVSQLNAYKKYFSELEIDSSDKLSNAITEMRIVKTQTEIDNMIKAQRIAERAFDNVLNIIKPGKTEREIGLALDYYMLGNGAEALSFDTIAIAGANTSLPHGVPGDYVIRDGDFVLMDYGAVFDGYHSDMTRTVCVGKPDEEKEKVYNIVLEAQTKALAQVRAGISGKELDKIARDVISDAGYGDRFGHSLGHGVGVEIHEAPNAAPSSVNILRENMIITVEPGIYLPDKFGVRIEDFVVVKENGCVNMTECEKKLICL